MVFKLGNLARALLAALRRADDDGSGRHDAFSGAVAYRGGGVFVRDLFLRTGRLHIGNISAAAGAGSVSAPIAAVIKTIYVFVPRLDRFDVRERLVNDMPVAFNYAWKAFGGGLIYVAAVLCVAYFIFSDREF